MSTISELHRFLFEGLPVRGAIVRLTGGWQEVLSRRAASSGGAYPQPVRALLGEMAAASILMQSNVKFNGALILQIMGDGPVKLAVAQAQADLGFRCTATVIGEVPADAKLSAMVNVHNDGRCAITLDPQDRQPGQQPYQGVVPLFDDARAPIESLAKVLEHYMLQSEQLDTCLVLAANDEAAAGILVQRMPSQGGANLDQNNWGQSNWGQVAINETVFDEKLKQLESDPHYVSQSEDFNRIAILASSITADELLSLPSLDVLHRLFWEEKLLRHPPQTSSGSSLLQGDGPRFACTCSRERVGGMLRSLGPDEAEGILAEQGSIEVGCEFCGKLYRFDAVDAAQIFIAANQQLPPTGSVQ